MCFLFILLILVPTLELYLLVAIGEKIGPMNTIALIVLTGFLGSILMKLEGWRAWQNFKKGLKQGELPGKRIVDGFLILIGGIFLITPGILTDILGLLLIFPLTRIFFRERLMKILQDKFIHSHIVTVYPENSAYPENPHIVTVYPENSESQTNKKDSEENLRRIEKNARFDERKENPSL